MPRLVIHEAHGPSEVKVGDKSVFICRCGLTKNKDGTCSTMHKKTLDEDDNKMYAYNDDGSRYEVEEDDDECCGNCGDGNCHCHDEND